MAYFTECPLKLHFFIKTILVLFDLVEHWVTVNDVDCEANEALLVLFFQSYESLFKRCFVISIGIEKSLLFL